MRLKSLKQIRKGRFLSGYELTYSNKEEKDKVYEMVSREDDLSADTIGKRTAGVAIAGFKDDRVLLIKEFRMGVNQWVWAFPAGLIDGNETAKQAAARELNILNPSFSCTGVTDEKSYFVFCKVDGNIQECDFPDEDIKAGLYTKEEVRKLLETEVFSARTQAVCYLWSRG